MIPQALLPISNLVRIQALDKDLAQAKRGKEQTNAIESQEFEPDGQVQINNNSPLAVTEQLSKSELNFLEIKRLRCEGHSIKSIHRQTGVHRQTIKKYLKYEEYSQVISGRAISELSASILKAMPTGQ